MRRKATALYATVIAFLLWFSGSVSAQDVIPRSVIVTSESASLREQPSATAKVLKSLHRADVIAVEDVGDWWKTEFYDYEPKTAWISKSETSAAYELSYSFGSDEVAAALERNVSGARQNSLVWSWLAFHQGHLFWAREQFDRAVDVFASIGRLSPPSEFSPLGYIAAAKVRLSQRRSGNATQIYAELLTRFPAFTLPGNCNTLPIAIEPALGEGANICWGHPSIATRIAAWKELENSQAAIQRTLNGPAATPAQRANLLYRLGQAWERADAVDPSFAISETFTVVSKAAEEAYHAAIAAGPGSRGAGYGAWRLISFGRPYELEGSYEPEAERWLEQYGAFLRTYPRHPLSGEAMFMVAKATWAKAGYPAVFDYYQTNEVSGPGRERLEQWFDTRYFGGAIEVVQQRTQETRPALKLFREIAARYPMTESASMAQYYAAVILDWCLNEPRAALAEYQRFIARYPSADKESVTRARARIAALQMPK